MGNAANGEGWVKVFYQLLEWEWYGDPNMVALFIHLLLRANYKPSRKGGIEYGRGVVLTSREQLARETGISEQTIRTCLNRLKSTNEITIKSTKKGSIITICNYDKYQSQNETPNQQNSQPANHQSTNSQPTTNQQLTTCIEYKKERIYYVVVDYAREKFLQDFFSEEKMRSLEELCMNMHTDLATMKRLAEAVLNEWEATDEPMHPDMNRAKQHLISQIRIKLNAERREATQNTNGSRTAARRAPDAPRKVNDQWDKFDFNSIPTK